MPYTPAADSMVPPGGTGAVDGGGMGGAGGAGSASFGGMASGAGVGSSASLGGGGYMDLAIPMTQFRLRYDAAYDNNRPDRAEFFYAKCGCFGNGAPGPRLAETSVDYQDISGYLELAAGNRLSGFVEVPFRFLNPEVNANTSGFADMFAGFKAALVASPDRYLTFQFRTAIPTGAASHGLGTDHVSLEPALLFWQQVTKGLFVQAEIRDWIPIGGTDFAGNILRYGIGAGYDIYNNGDFWVQPWVELVGWTVLSGMELNPDLGKPVDSSGESILNGKFGARIGWGNSSIYAGYGRALTGDVWYKDVFRVEYRLVF
jgi:hypothetical protein